PALLDIIAPAIPPLAEITSALGLAPGRIEVRFTPDRLSWPWDSTKPYPSGLMARGPYPAATTPSLLTTMRI
ncbi:hypothetical protein, partial [Vannielia litorea]|uniref:hypothetical protein n=1 Tax=Vannielia litorea TaxID=1217970 RepID=UPI001BCD0670